MFALFTSVSSQSRVVPGTSQALNLNLLNDTVNP